MTDSLLPWRPCQGCFGLTVVTKLSVLDLRKIEGESTLYRYRFRTIFDLVLVGLLLPSIQQLPVELPFRHSCSTPKFLSRDSNMHVSQLIIEQNTGSAAALVQETEDGFQGDTRLRGFGAPANWL
ncbi:hypothetical protein Y032_0850g2681 [Ancylostoma ceylanicum]|uniref:Uncharacterized protein n=1 Tax=Ancylostoma ceylanicum TaxID=53326 RepID=A0A016WAH9_9BILA|nr:hypothetical protein Y032_0850g2681 [Ancylostoma ceylanicum]